MPELRNPRWEAFCQHYVELGVGSEALRRSGYRNKSVKVASADSARLLAYASIERRISELRAKASLNAKMERADLERWFASVVMTPIAHVTPDHPLAQSLEISDKGTKIRMPDKNTAAQALARLNGWDAPTKLELSADNPLTAYLRELRAKAVEGRVSGVGDTVQRIDDDGHGATHDP